MTPLSTAPFLPTSQFTVCTSRFTRLRKRVSQGRSVKKVPKKSPNIEFDTSLTLLQILWDFLDTFLTLRVGISGPEGLGTPVYGGSTRNSRSLFFNKSPRVEALGSSAPEIMLSINDISKRDFYSGECSLACLLVREACVEGWQKAAIRTSTSHFFFTNGHPK